jgi:periplasmic protein CpxP/Spy
MKKLITTTVAILLLAVTLSAQKRKCGNEDANKKHNITKKLDLNEEQKTKANQISAQFKEKRKALEANDKMTVGDYKAKKEALKKEQKAAMENILTAEQKAKMQEMAKNRKAKVEGKKGKKKDKQEVSK